MHMCSYCGIEYDPAESVCPACGHKNENPAPPHIKSEKVSLHKTKEKKAYEKEPFIKDTETKEKDSKFYKDTLAKLEKSPAKDTEKKEIKGEKEKGKKEIIKKKRATSPPLVKGVETSFPAWTNLLYTSKFSYIFWFVFSLFIISTLSGYRYGAMGWIKYIIKLFFTSDIAVKAALLNVHHRINNFNPFTSFFILNSDVLLFIPVFSCFFPLILWYIKKRQRGVTIAGNSNIFAGLILSQASVLIFLFILRVASFDYFMYTIILAIAICSPFLDLVILLFIFKPEDFNFKNTIVVFLYNIGTGVMVIVVSMAFEFISIFLY